MIMPVSGTKMQDATVYCPTGVTITKKYLDVTSRVDTLEGKRVGLLWNGKPNGDLFLNRVAELLEKNYQNIEIIKFWEVNPERTAMVAKYSDEVLDQIANSVDIVIASSAD